jgi:hypothetical protein
MPKVVLHITIDANLDRAVRNLKAQKTELSRAPLIELTDWSSLSSCYNYILKLGLIKFTELKADGKKVRGD